MRSKPKFDVEACRMLLLYFYRNKEVSAVDMLGKFTSVHGSWAVYMKFFKEAGIKKDWNEKLTMRGRWIMELLDHKHKYPSALTTLANASGIFD